LDEIIDSIFPLISFGISYIPKDTLIFRARTNEKEEQFKHIKDITLRETSTVVVGFCKI
jgi:hypothetical protein